MEYVGVANTVDSTILISVDFDKIYITACIKLPQILSDSPSTNLLPMLQMNVEEACRKY